LETHPALGLPPQALLNKINKVRVSGARAGDHFNAAGAGSPGRTARAGEHLQHPSVVKYRSCRVQRWNMLAGGRPSTSAMQASWSAPLSPGNAGYEERSSGNIAATLHKSISKPEMEKYMTSNVQFKNTQ